MPNLEERVNHILTKQVFGIGITHLTSLLARRSVYCSKLANGEHSIAKGFDSEAGNIWFERLEHTWGDTKCEFCGAPKTILDREAGLENYAYAFIHTNDIKARIAELFGDNMQFDVIIGNPPYQMKGGAGGTSDSSIYHLFVEQAIRLEPRYLSMVIPSAGWRAGAVWTNSARPCSPTDTLATLLTTRKCQRPSPVSILRAASGIFFGAGNIKVTRNTHYSKAMKATQRSQETLARTTLSFETIAHLGFSNGFRLFTSRRWIQ
jgi:hypothetical protein